ncbi:hypothetical protein [Tardiphaga robiniae]|uniref:Uncharacterized protein n=1 Tax=Tardiphaga robiniae TaxID=943830 RepID=A0A7G6U826_9BRAD|nr:hypothetical protein [Tardiphaga robiniae]QND75158.1 hypothetical protein HB776_31055 [Tardiphaga robiniae]
MVRWMVWDCDSRKPAFARGVQLLNIPREQAERLQSEMNGFPTSVPTDRLELSANELAWFVRAESDLTMPFPQGVDITVRPGRAPGIWRVTCYSPDPVRDAAFTTGIELIANELNQKFALKVF